MLTAALDVEDFLSPLGLRVLLYVERGTVSGIVLNRLGNGHYLLGTLGTSIHQPENPHIRVPAYLPFHEVPDCGRLIRTGRTDNSHPVTCLQSLRPGILIRLILPPMDRLSISPLVTISGRYSPSSEFVDLSYRHAINLTSVLTLSPIHSHLPCTIHGIDGSPIGVRRGLGQKSLDYLSSQGLALT